MDDYLVLTLGWWISIPLVWCGTMLIWFIPVSKSPSEWMRTLTIALVPSAFMVAAHGMQGDIWWLVPSTWLAMTMTFLLKDGVQVYRNNGDASFVQLLSLLGGVPITLMFLTRWMP